jgi:hypothetical protein
MSVGFGLLVSALCAALEAGTRYGRARGGEPLISRTWCNPPGIVPRVVPSPPRRSSTIPPAAHTVDIKISFEQTNMIPGPKGRVFRRNCLVHGGKADSRGYSIADCFLRRDEGAVVGPCFTPAGALNVPGVGGILLAPGGAEKCGSVSVALRVRRSRVCTRALYRLSRGRSAAVLHS